MSELNTASPMSYKETKREFLEKNPAVKKEQNRRLGRFWLKAGLVEGGLLAVTVASFLHTPQSAIVGAALMAVAAVLLYRKSPYATPVLCGVALKEGMDTRQTGNKGGAVLNFQSQTSFTLLVDRGDGIAETLTMDVSCEKAFRVGDKVIVLRGIPTPLNLTPHDFLPCYGCGNVIPRVGEGSPCPFCGAEEPNP